MPDESRVPSHQTERGDNGVMPTDMRHFGPMHGERSRRHQMTAESNDREDPDRRGILTIYEKSQTDLGPLDPDQVRLYVEVMVGTYTHRLHLTVDEAREAAGAFAEFVRCWQGGEP